MSRVICVKIGMLLAVVVYHGTSQAWSVGIKGVVSVGSSGTKVGPKAEGTDVKTPNVGGDVAKTLEKSKNFVTGEDKRLKEQNKTQEAEDELKKQRAVFSAIQADYEKSLAELTNLQSEFGTERERLSKQADTIQILYTQYRRQLNVTLQTLTAAGDGMTPVREAVASIWQQSSAQYGPMDAIFEKLKKSSVVLPKAVLVLAADGVLPDAKLFIDGLKINSDVNLSLLSAAYISVLQFSSIAYKLLGSDTQTLLKSVEDGIVRQTEGLHMLDQMANQCANDITNLKSETEKAKSL